MKQLKIIIERSKDQFSAYAENVNGIYGGGDTVEETKQSIEDAIRLLKKYNKSDQISPILNGKYEIVYKFDVESLLNYYKRVFSNAALERITGINQKQIQHYSTGLKKPRAVQVKKIETALHKLGAELLSVEL
jgi:predicted RNase H-like HicB family nuclease